MRHIENRRQLRANCHSPKPKPGQTCQNVWAMARRVPRDTINGSDYQSCGIFDLLIGTIEISN
eukprot:scaffold79198_cov40-Cyclotella_meneghiniana.AAC.2